MSAALLMAACGSDVPPLAQGSIAGAVWASGPVAGATVRVVLVDTEGEPAREVGSGKAGPDGRFEVDVGSAAGTLIVEALGGTFTESNGGEPVTLDERPWLRGAVVGFTAGEVRANTAVTPLTTLAVAQAEARYRYDEATGFASFRDALERTTDRIGNHFGAVPIATTLPADVMAPGESTTTADVRYGTCLAGLSWLAHRIRQDAGLSPGAASTAHVTELLAADLSDQATLFDGTGPSGAVGLGECVAGETICQFTANTPRARVGEGIYAFVSSQWQVRGLTIEDVALLVENLRVNDAPELFPAYVGPEPVDREAPVITWEGDTPPADAPVGAPFEVRARASDDLTAKPQLWIGAPDWLVGSDADGDPTNEIVIATIDPATRPPEESEIVVELHAVDDVGVLGTASRRFFIDRGPPIIEVVSPLPDLYTRTDFVLDARAHDSSLESFVVGAPPELAGIDVVLGTEQIYGTVPIAGFDDGVLTLTLRAADAAGYETQLDVPVTIDRIDPAITIGTTPHVIDGAWSQVPVQVTVSVSDASPVSLTVQHGGTAATESFLADTSALHLVEAQAQDAAGNSSSAALAFHVDQVAPVVVLVSGPADGSYVRGTVTLVAEMNDNLAADGSLPLADATLWYELSAAAPRRRRPRWWGSAAGRCGAPSTWRPRSRTRGRSACTSAASTTPAISPCPSPAR